MSSSQYRRELQRKRDQRVDAEKRAGQHRIKESEKRAEADKLRQAASKTNSESTARSKLRDAERRDGEAATAGKEANRWQKRASDFAKEESTLAVKVARAEQSELTAAEKQRQTHLKRVEQSRTAERATLEARVVRAESAVRDVLRRRAPQREKLRILILGASSEGDLRVGREAKRIRAAVESALHRDLVEIDVRPAATTGDLLDGITRFRPHVLHFSGHSNKDLLVFESDIDEPHHGNAVSANAFASAVKASDDPPLLVLLNACKSAAQIDHLVQTIVPFAIGMADSIDDGDAISYAAQFYAAVANGQSIKSAHLSGRAALELAGLAGSELPTLAWSTDSDPASAVLVTRPAATG